MANIENHGEELSYAPQISRTRDYGMVPTRNAIEDVSITVHGGARA